MLPCSITPQKNYPGGNEIVNFGGPFLGYHYHILILSDLCPEVERERFLKKYINFTPFTPKLSSLEVRGHET